MYGGMLRIHLTAEDLLKTRFAGQPAPLVETGLAIAALKRRDPLFRAWRRSAATRFPAAARPLLELIPPTGTGPLFLDPVSDGLAEGLELVQSAPAWFVAGELRRVAGSRPPGPWLRSLAARDRGTWRDLDQALRAAHRHLVEGAWPRILTAFRSDLAWRGRLIGEVGARAAISSLHPGIGWDGTVLQIETAREMDFYPGGAGLTLLPTPMWTGRAMVAGWRRGPVTIVYPAMTPLPLVDEAASDALAGLLGHTRAAVLRLALTERTTTQLASELGVSAATVSGHTKALRAAGLIATARSGRAVLHSVTPLGGRLLGGATGHPAAPGPA